MVRNRRVKSSDESTNTLSRERETRDLRDRSRSPSRTWTVFAVTVRHQGDAPPASDHAVWLLPHHRFAETIRVSVIDHMRNEFLTRHGGCVDLFGTATRETCRVECTDIRIAARVCTKLLTSAHSMHTHFWPRGMRKLAFNDETLPSSVLVHSVVHDYEVDATADATLAAVFRRRCGLGVNEATGWLLEDVPLWPSA